MKSYNEMAKNALRRIDEENKIIIKRRKILKRTLIPSLSLCLVAVISFSVVKAFQKNQGVETEEEYVIEESFVENEYENAIGSVDGETTKGDSEESYKENGNPPANDQTTHDACIRIIDVRHSNKTYLEIKNYDTSVYTKENFLGNTTDFEGYYKDKNIKGRVYTVKDYSEFLLIELEDGQKILLKGVV